MIQKLKFKGKNGPSFEGIVYQNTIECWNKIHDWLGTRKDPTFREGLRQDAIDVAGQLAIPGNWIIRHQNGVFEVRRAESIAENAEQMRDETLIDSGDVKLSVYVEEDAQRLLDQQEIQLQDIWPLTDKEGESILVAASADHPGGIVTKDDIQLALAALLDPPEPEKREPTPEPEEKPRRGRPRRND